MKKKWVVLPEIDNALFKEFPDINPVVLKLLINRGLTDQKSIDQFLNPNFDNDLHDPYLFVDMKKAADRIINALQKNEKILVFGDYDADGVSSSVLMVSTLQALGGDVGVYIPHRETEGYGLNDKSVDILLEKDYKLIITVDCGISNKDQVIRLQDTGIDVIITDHHTEPLELPPAYALINPQLSRDNYPFNKLAGVGVAYKTMQGLFKRLKEKDLNLNPDFFAECGGYSGYEKWLLDMVAIGTVADCMPLLNENRVFVKYGLKVIKKTKHIGLLELLNHAGADLEKIKTYTIGFQIGPRINAAGRLGHANVAYNLLMTTDKKEACELSEQLNSTNVERQKITIKIMNEAKAQIQDKEGAALVIALGDDWPVGVVGLVAGKLVDVYGKPVIMMTKAKGPISASGRSIPAFNMIESLQLLDHYFTNYGGHSQACGFTLQDDIDLDEFKNDLQTVAAEAVKGKDLTPIIKVEGELVFSNINWALVELLELFQPFGYGNQEPSFLIKNIEIVDVKTLGKTNAHLRMVLKQGSSIQKAIAFGFGEVWSSQLRSGDKIDILCNVGINEWNGNREIQLKVVDMRFSA